MAERLMVNDVIMMAAEERAALTDEAIKGLAYGLQYADSSILAETSGGAFTCQEAEPILRELRARLASIDAARQAAKRAQQQAAAPVEKFTCAHCGGRFPRRLAMSSSTGTVCPDCYDDASD
jgi:hypothetical protein